MTSPKSGYKLVKSFFGKYEEIPEEWEIQKLSNLCEKEKDIVAGPFGSNLMVSDYASNGVPILRLQNIDRNKFIEKNIKFISSEKAKELSYHSYEPNDLILAKLGDPIGKTCRIPKHFPSGIVVADVVRIRTSPKKSDSDFVEYVLNSWICTKQFDMERIGTTRPRVNLEQIRNLIFPCPPKHEQQKIASILSNVDNLINSYDGIIQTTKKLKKGLMQQLLTKGIGHKKFKKVNWLFGKEIEIPENWEINSLDKISKKILDGEHISPEFTINGIPYLSSRHIKSKILFHNCKYVSNETFSKIIQRIHPEYDDILITVKGTIGFCKRLDIREKFCMDRNVGLIKPLKKIINSIFLEQMMKSTIVQKQILGLLDNNVIPSLYLNRIRKIKIFVPSIIEQQKIATISSTVDFKILDLELKKTRLEKLKKGLMQKLLTGQIRV